jgi:NAD-dependent dihydropyrimidine dehydrogenase PreA subunit
MIQAKDSHYNNRPGEELKKGTFDPNKLRYELSIVDTNMAMFSGDYSVQLQAPVSGDEMFLPVRNRSCVGSASCIWPLNDLFDYLKNNTFVDTDGELCYYCINCFKNGGMSNKRSFSKLYLDKELSLYIAQARQHYT